MGKSIALAAVMLLAASWAGGGMIVIPWHELNEIEIAQDRLPPGVPEFRLHATQRGQLPRQNADGSTEATSHDDFGILTFTLRPPGDDRTAPAEMGYRFLFVDGNLPRGLTIHAGAQRAMPFRDPSGIAPADSVMELKLYWVDGVRIEQDPFDFRVALIAVDLGGNESASSDTLRVRHDGNVTR
jgi:hypothetical protein